MSDETFAAIAAVRRDLAAETVSSIFGRAGTQGHIMSITAAACPGVPG